MLDDDVRGMLLSMHAATTDNTVLGGMPKWPANLRDGVCLRKSTGAVSRLSCQLVGSGGDATCVGRLDMGFH